MKKLIFHILCISILLTLPSCGKTESEHKIKDKSSKVITALSNASENGMLYFDENTCNFYDYASDITIPLCFKPNCTHSDQNCISKAITGSVNSAGNCFIFNDCIYYFSVNESIEGEGRDTTYQIQSTLHQWNLQSGEKTDVLEIPDLNCTSSVNMVFHDDTIYFIGCYGAHQFEDGTWMNAGYGKQYLCSVDLKDCSFENYGQVNDNVNASNNVIITENSINAVADQVTIAGVYHDTIYLYYNYVEDKNIIINAMDQGDNQTIDWNYEVKEFHLNSREMCISREQPPICLSNNWYVTENSSDKTITAKDQTGNTIEFSSKNDLPFDSYQYSIYNNKIWDLYNGVVYDLSTKEIYSVSENFLGANVTDYIAKENKYVVCSYDASGKLIYQKFDESSLIA